MTQFSCRLFRIVRHSGPSARRPRRGTSLRPDEGPAIELERRALQSIVSLSADASPMVLTRIDPMNQPRGVRESHIRPVTLAGYASVDNGVVPSLSFRVVDEYGRDQPSG